MEINTKPSSLCVIYLRQGKHVIKVTKRQTMTLVYPDQGQNRKLDEEGKDVV